MNQSAGCCCSFAHNSTLTEYIQGPFGRTEFFDYRMFSVNFLIIISIEYVVDFMSCDDCLKICHREDYTCINLAGVKNNCTVKMPKSISGLQIVETQKRSYHGTISNWITAFVVFN